MEAYQRLLTFDEVDTEALGSIDLSSLQSETEKAIEYATRQIEEYLQRRLIVRERTDLGRNVSLEFDFDVSTDSTSYYSYYTGDWPVLEPIEVFPSDYTLQVHPDERRFYTEFDNFNYAIRRVRYYAGYRRTDQVLSNPSADETKLPTGDGEALDGLTTLPPTLPEDIRSTCLRITVHRLKAMKGDGLGMGERSFNVGAGQTVTAAGVDPDFVQRELETLDKHRSVAW